MLEAGRLLAAVWSLAAAADAAPDGLRVIERDGRVEAQLGGQTVFAWQREPLAQPKGGDAFRASTFIHPLRTPGGFEVTAIQAPDHLHHFGLWWPWKFVEVEGRRYNCWEIQQGEGAMVAREVKVVESGPERLAWEFSSEYLVRQGQAEPRPVIRETARVELSCPGNQSTVLDIRLDQGAVGSPVRIVEYRYSGFSWRGPLGWNQGNSRLLTSDGHQRDNANGKPARWVLVSGPAPHGTVSVLLLSAAAKLAGQPERLRVWDSATQGGMPFVNFNPVLEKSLPLDAANPAVARRKYRVVAADHAMDAANAEEMWRQWVAP